ncbi:ferric reductase [Spathaspora passalidarum NRRL Y-27907]|uniref:ferric-chelate reductase (NADPH) n=1 Tax=Spathaspora passalidarum (strain NRRL Y-27907 / 11-Y1) TaxID=619300 RepID=G3AVR5_SPAPN|nr:ferric reductase [Spathaspora passalidarum NRRL Y-27907]EGW30230.1 ferric reductase [Spathaspora passalidarum NRRL Y-27907]
MTSTIPFDQQYFVETERNRKYQWLSFIFGILIFIAHGLLFFWLPRYLRLKREIKAMKYRPFFVFLEHWETLNRCFCFKIPFINKNYYYKPSLLILFSVFIAINARFSMMETSDIDYLPQYYVISKRVGRVAMGNMPAVYIMVTKNDFVAALTGLSPDRLVFYHFWFSRLIYFMIVAHIVVGTKYWNAVGFKKMLTIPPQIFGWIAFGCFTMLVFGNLKFIRQYAFDFFMVKHRIYSFIFLLLAFFHNGGNKAMVILAVHLLVIDRIVGRVFGIIHRVKSPTKSWSEFEILDDDTLKVTVPMKMSKTDVNKWYNLLLPKYGTWKAGSHVLLNVGKISLFQYHPFTIVSMPETGKMVMIIKKKNGFTKKLYNRKENKDKDLSFSSSVSSQESPSDSEPEPDYKRVTDPNIVKMKAGINGPFFPKHQPLITFDSVAFFAIGVGASFIFPICLDLLQEIEKRELENDYMGRPSNPTISIYWSVRNFADISWYSESMYKLSKYINSRKLLMQIYITREINETITENSVITSTSKADSDFSSPDVLTEKFYGSRMDVQKLVQGQAAALNFPEENSYRSFAVLSCGSEDFGKTVEMECQKLRGKKEAPNIYFYNESF